MATRFIPTADELADCERKPFDLNEEWPVDLCGVPTASMIAKLQAKHEEAEDKRVATAKTWVNIVKTRGIYVQTGPMHPMGFAYRMGNGNRRRQS